MDLKMSLETVKAFDLHAEEYDQWFDCNSNVFNSELMALRKVMPFSGDALEVGVGSGRFANEVC
jgi:hypothetical protein